MTKRRTYRINADRWTTLMDILVGDPEDFNSDSSSLRGRIDTSPMWGKLPGDEITIMNDRQVRYVIYSYNTPIAYRYITHWLPTGQPVFGWCVPDVRYSVTTSKHQGKVRTALSQISGGYNV